MLAKNLFVNHLWTLAAQVVHLHLCLQTSNMQFNAPSAIVKFGQFFGFVCFGVYKGCCESYNFGSEASLFNLVLQMSDEDVAWEGSILFHAHPLRTWRLCISDKLIEVAKL